MNSMEDSTYAQERERERDIYLHNSVPFRGRCTRLAQKRLHTLKLGAVRYLRDYSNAPI